MKRLVFLLAFAPLCGISQAGSTRAAQTAASTTLVPDSIAPDSTGIRNVTSAAFTFEMAPGWNVGNSLEATSGETSWGNPLITKKLIDSVKAAGFNTVRIPVAWSRFSNAATFTIDTTFMTRVETVVNYVLQNGMYAVMNIHWDGGWMQPTAAQQDYVNNRLAIMWKQIAIRFRNYDDHLIFAGTNEVMVTNNYASPSKEYYTAQNSFNQTFVTTVRATGGRNYYRFLAVQGFNTNIEYTLNFFAMPADVVEKKLLVEVHYYDPYDFTLNGNSKITQWGKYANTPANTETWANEAYTDAQFQKMKARFVDNGYGVIVGEYGAQSRLYPKGSDVAATHAEFRRYYMQYVTQSMVKHALVPIYWDNGGTGDKSMGVFNRSTGARAFPDIINAIVHTSDSIAPVHIYTSVQAIRNGEQVKVYPNPVNDMVTLELNANATTHVRLYNAYGQKLETWNVAIGSNTFDVAKLQAGLYFIEIASPEGIVVKKMEKM